ncbi:unnamed protein product [Paramecium primaurelia]|uniref:Transmembrane protein n=1 Tax=Paramecium primaurelia TaxID=5886 RepID=A0A8S1Q497_PARPR|nr:unnamed protein product [Paramecium primaurelia]
MLVGQPNTVLLQQYTPKDIEAPYYQIENSNIYNLEIQQSILPLFNQVFNSSEIIIFASNYIEVSGIYSNYFWFLSNQQILYAGMLDNFGSLIIEKIDVQILNLECQYINLITHTQGILTCLNQQQISFLVVNSTSVQYTQYNTNYSLPQEYLSLKANLYYLNDTAYQIFISYITNMDANLVIFKYFQNSLVFVNSFNFSGSYYQIEIIQSNLFLLDSNSIQFLDLVNSSKTGTIQIQNSGNQLNYMAVCEINNHLFRIAVLDNLQLYIYNFNPEVQIPNKKTINSFIINPYQKMIQISITINSIYIITNNFIMKLSGEQVIFPSSFLPLQQCNYALIQYNRQIIVTQQLLNGEVIFSTFLFNNPQIKISINQTFLIEQNTKSYQLQLLIIPQTLQQIKRQIQIWIMPQNLTNSKCPIPFQHKMNDLYLNFPDQYNIPFTEVFLGPNLTQSMTSQNPQLLYADTSSNYFKSTINSYSIITLELCSIYDSSAIYCSQYKNFSVEISYWNPILQNQNLLITTNQTMQSCSCIMTQEYINILIELNDTILIQQFNYQSQPKDFYKLTMPIQILSSALLKETLFVITIDGNLTAYFLKHGQSSLFTISNYTFKYIYTNLINYPNFLFIDNQVNLIILSYKGYQSYEIVNSISYPIVNYNQIQIGILQTGIYMAIVEQNNNYLYFYPIQNVYISNSLQNYYQVDLLGYQFQTGQIISSYTPKHFYLILQNQYGIFCAYFSGSDSPFNSFVYSNFLFASSQNVLIISMSVVQKQKYNIELVQIFTNKSQAVNGSVLYGEFQIVPYFLETNYSYMTTVSYLAQDQNCSLQLQQKVNILFERQFITQKQFNSESQVLKIQNNTKLIINPSNLFNGNIKNYSINCIECKSLNFTQPINGLTSQTLNFSFQAAVKNNNMIFIQNNISLFQLNEQTGVYSQIYNFPYQNTYCVVIFIDKFTQFPVSICANETTTIYAYNLTGNIGIQYNFSECSNFYKANYNNGVLQVLTINYKRLIQQYSYQSFYFWISNNKIYLEQIFNSSNLCSNSYLEFVYLSMSTNYTTQPCQIFGFTSLQKNGIYNPIFYLLNTCISTQISQQFGFQSNSYAQIFNIYFSITTWNLYQTLPIYFKFLSDIQQYQISKLIAKDFVVESQFIISLSYSIEIYAILFNLNNGTIIGFHKYTSLFLSYNSNVSGYFIFQGFNGIIINQNFVNFTFITTNIYARIENYSIDEKLVQIIGQEFYTLQLQGLLLFSVVTENYLFFTNNFSNQTIVYPLQNWLEIDVDITGVQQSQIDIIASNQQSSAKQTYFLLNEAYQSIPQEQEKQNVGLIVGLSIFLLIVITLITTIILKYFKYKQTLTRNSNYFELENRQ